MEAVVATLVLAASKKAYAEGTRDTELASRSSSAAFARSARILDQRSHTLFRLKANAKCLQALLRELNGRDLSNSRLLLYTEDEGKAFLLQQLSEKVARKPGGMKAKRSFFSLVGDTMLDKSTMWATDQLLRTKLWSEGAPLAGHLPGCEFEFQWGPDLEGSGHSYSDTVRAITSAFSLDFNRAATNRDTHERLPRLVKEMDAMVADLEECREGESWMFGDGEWLSSESSRSAAYRVVNFVRKMRGDTHFRLPDVARLMVDGIVHVDDVRRRAEGVGAAYVLVVAFRGIVACSIGNRMVGIRFLTELTRLSSSTFRRESALLMVASLDLDATLAEVGGMGPKDVEEAIGSKDLYTVFGPGYGVGVSNGRCVLDLSGRQRSHPAEGILELGGSVLPDLSKRYGDRETLKFGDTIVSKRKAMTRVAFVRDTVATKLAAHYKMVDIGGFEVNSLSMMLGSLNLTYLTSENAGLYQSWIYPALWSRLCSGTYDAESSTHLALYEYADRKVSAWNTAAACVNGPVLSSAALYMATEVIGKRTMSYDGEFGCWCEALGLKRVRNTESGILADQPFAISKCMVWQTETGKAVRLGGQHLTLTRDKGNSIDHVVQGVACSRNGAIPPTEESVKLGAEGRAWGSVGE